MTCKRRKSLSRSKTFIILIAFVCFFHGSFALAEVIDGPANLRDKPNGKVIAVLNNNVEVEMYPPYVLDKVWYSIVFIGYVEKRFYIAESGAVRANSNLLNEQGQIIGKTLEDIKADWDIGENNGRVGVVINHICTHKGNIKASSIPETELAALLDSRETTIQKSELQQLLDKYAFQNWSVVKDKEIEDYFIHENTLYDLSPMPRLQLIFYKNTLISVIHRGLLHNNKYPSRELFREMKRMDVAKIDADVSKRIQKRIIEPLKTAD